MQLKDPPNAKEQVQECPTVPFFNPPPKVDGEVTLNEKMIHRFRDLLAKRANAAIMLPSLLRASKCNFGLQATQKV
jgi:hypothetical protein